MKLLIAEEDKLSQYLEHLEFAERPNCEKQRSLEPRQNHARWLYGSPEHAQAERLLANVQAIHELLERLCHRIREMVNLRGHLGPRGVEVHQLRNI